MVRGTYHWKRWCTICRSTRSQGRCNHGSQPWCSFRCVSLYVCLICTYISGVFPYMYVLYVCLICTYIWGVFPYMYVHFRCVSLYNVLYVCLICMPCMCTSCVCIMYPSTCMILPILYFYHSAEFFFFFLPVLRLYHFACIAFVPGRWLFCHDSFFLFSSFLFYSARGQGPEWVHRREWIWRGLWWNSGQTGGRNYI